MTDKVKRVVKGLSEEWVDEGKLIEAGWSAMREMAIPTNASSNQVDDMRMAFFAGAQHLWSSVLTILSPDAEPTEKDIQRMELIDRELRAFYDEMKRRHGWVKQV